MELVKNENAIKSFISSDSKTMSSLEIAELTGKQHKNVIRDIDKVLTEAGIDALKFESTYSDTQSREKKCYNLPRFECDLLITGYSVKYRALIIKRWHELEGKDKPMSRRQFAELQLQMVIELEEKEQEVKELRIELDDSKEWASIKKIESATGGDYSWRKLKASSIKLGYDRPDVFDQNYGTVKAYHKDAWLDAYGIDIEKYHR